MELEFRYNMDIIWKLVKRPDLDPHIVIENVKAEKLDQSKQDNIVDSNDNIKTVQIYVSEYKYYRNCGNKLPKDSNFCDSCGSRTNYQ